MSDATCPDCAKERLAHVHQLQEACDGLLALARDNGWDPKSKGGSDDEG